ncbi:MAG: hypothetical protein JSR18_09230 [Proteobacteria bacterium]|nr:hypothetical protein [Pseudomonadota bacterium]
MTNAVPVSFVVHPPQQGALWLRQSFAMFRAARLPWLVLLFLYYFVILVARIIPFLAYVLPVLKPVFAVGFLAAAWSQERGGRPRPADLFRGFRANLVALVLLGLFLMAGMTLATLATSLVDDGKLIDLFVHPPALDAHTDPDAAGRRVEAVFADGRVQLGMMLAVACALPVLLAMWFAPALVVFQDRGALSALGTSLRAALANWRAIVTYVLCVFALMAVVPALLLTIIGVLGSFGGDALRVVLTFVILMPYLAIVMATLQISDYVAYRDVFHPDEPVSPGEA